MRLRNYVATVLMLCFVGLSAQKQAVRFEHLTTKNGLSINRVTSIYKDKLGYMWFGTYWGLNRYDGHEFVNYFHEKNADQLSLSHNSVIWIAEGFDDFIFVQTGSLLSAFDIYKERFVDISYILNALPVDSGQITKVHKDKNDSFWFLCRGFGVLRMDSLGTVTYLNDEDKKKYKNHQNVKDIKNNPDGTLTLLHSDGYMAIIDPKSHDLIDQWQLKDIKDENFPLEFIEDTDGGLWVYAQNRTEGVYYYKTKHSNPERIKSDVLGSNLISEVLEDDLKHIIIATDHGGMTMIDLKDGSSQRYIHNPSDPTSLNHYGAISAYKDEEGTIWIGTNKGGVSYYNLTMSQFNYYKYSVNDDEIINDINALVFDSEEKIWIGSDRNGLMQFDVKTGRFALYNPKSGKTTNSLKSNTIVSMAKDDKGLWIGTYQGGLSFFDGKKFINYIENSSDEFPDKSIWSLYKDSRGNLWVGTLLGGLVIFDANHHKVEELTAENGRISSNYITSIDEDELGNIWVGTGYGVHVFDYKRKRLNLFINDNENPDSLANNSIETLYCNKKGEVWIGTQNGLSKYDMTKKVFTNLNKKDGFVSGYIVSIEQDDQGVLWIGTNKGLSSVTQVGDQYVIRNFNESDGIQSELFNQNSSGRSNKGLLAFAGANGLNVFKSEDIGYSTNNNSIVFNSLRISNQEVLSGLPLNGRVVLNDGINRLKILELKPYENSFSIGFAALNYNRPDKVSYRYMLQGFDLDWVVTNSNQRRANYTNMDPGKYRFLVQSTNDLNSWNSEPAEIDIYIDTPLWKTPLAYMGYVILVLMIVYFLLKIRIDRERLKAEMENDKLEAHRLHELDLMKIRFFTNIGHEFRTPLTLILTPIERVIKTVPESKFIREYMVIQKNAKRLLTLVNQLLDFRKMEAGQHKLSLSTGDLINFMNDIIDSFSDISKQNEVSVKVESDFKEFITEFDRDKMEKVMFNLFSNAFKFTKPNGRITLSIKNIEQHEDQFIVGISIADTGSGIPKDNLQHIFTRFYQSEVPAGMINHGTGIGLSITKEFVEIHDGQITVYSEINVGTTFNIEMPLRQLRQSAHSDIDLDQTDREINEANAHKKHTLLVVEDNHDFRYYMKDNLSPYYHILEAEDGAIGWEIVQKHKPDLVVSDVMMPNMDGLEMTTKIKKERKTKHIPVILLSSHQADEQKILGLKAGAIDFISKPFNFEILQNLISNALNYKTIIEDTEKRIEVAPSDIEITSLDEKMIQNALAIVEENMSNAEFSVQELSRELGVSRAQLYKKIVAITGNSPIEFIRDIRLKRAILLLEKSQLSISEIAYKVGFNNPRYFSNYFKEAYKVLPSKYIESVQPTEPQ